mmetsp:Transcript_95360/g.269881  ORF Transcript_95360/g.269881 Transcript_95360/m.269881 type:complete len:293 (-) Transcript_95360:3-881(-)
MRGPHCTDDDHEVVRREDRHEPVPAAEGDQRHDGVEAVGGDGPLQLAQVPRPVEHGRRQPGDQHQSPGQQNQEHAAEEHLGEQRPEPRGVRVDERGDEHRRQVAGPEEAPDVAQQPQSRDEHAELKADHHPALELPQHLFHQVPRQDQERQYWKRQHEDRRPDVVCGDHRGQCQQPDHRPSPPDQPEQAGRGRVRHDVPEEQLLHLGDLTREQLYDGQLRLHALRVTHGLDQAHQVRDVRLVAGLTQVSFHRIRRIELQRPYVAAIVGGRVARAIGGFHPHGRWGRTAYSEA